MEWIKENVAIFVLVLLVLLLVLMVIAISASSKVRKIYKHTVENQIKVMSNVELTSETNKVNLNITLYNASFKDVSIMGFGFLYKNQKIDFYDQIIKENKLTKLVIAPRDYINYQIKMSRFEELLNIVSYKNARTSLVKCYIVDSIGTEKYTIAKDLSKVIRNRQKERILSVKEQNKLIEEASKTPEVVETKQ